MTRAAANAAGILATLLLFLAPLSGQYQHASALAASSAVVAVLTAAAYCARLVPLVSPAAATQASVAAWAFTCEAALQTQHGPDAAGNPRPRAPGANHRTV
jgi:hypothetical protein